MVGTVRKRLLPRVTERAGPHAALLADAEAFIRQFHAEDAAVGPAEARVAAVCEEIAETGGYEHTAAELGYGARVAWRNSSRCIGRLYWRSLRVRDRRTVEGAEEVVAECCEHLAEATCGGKIRPTITVFAPDLPGKPGPCIWN